MKKNCLNECKMVPVSLEENGHKGYELAVWVGEPRQSNGTMCILVPGSSYDHTYWDFPFHPEKYSCVKYLTDAGYTILAYDRIGTGNSSLPPVDLVTGECHAYTVHQLVGMVKKGDLGNNRIDRIVVIAHSQGSRIALLEEILYHDVDALIISGQLHFNSFIGPAINRLMLNWVLASEDAKFTGKNIPPGYTTTRAGTRSQYFFNMETADPQTVRRDEELKGLATTFDAGSINVLDRTNDVKVPVFCVMGEYDLLFCNPPARLVAEEVCAVERAYFSEAAELEVYVLPGAGHCLNLHENAVDWYQAASNWIQRRISKQS